MKSVLIPDLRLSTTHLPNSSEAIVHAHHSGHKEIAFHATILSATKDLPSAWALTDLQRRNRHTLLLPLLRRFPFQRIWIFLDSLDDIDSSLTHALQAVTPHALLLVPPLLVTELSPAHSIATNSFHEKIFFLPDPRLIFHYWRRRQRILTFGLHAPVGYRLIAPAPHR